MIIHVYTCSMQWTIDVRPHTNVILVCEKRHCTVCINRGHALNDDAITEGRSYFQRNSHETEQTTNRFVASLRFIFQMSCVRHMWGGQYDGKGKFDVPMRLTVE